MRRAWVIAVIVAAMPAGPARAADTLIAEFPEIVPISARAGLLAYSRQAEAGRWQLVLWENGVARDAPVPTREAPFDVDLGFYPGGVVAAYSRCAAYVTCDLYRFNLAGTRERRLARVSTAKRDETRPAIHGGQVVFARGTELWTGLTDEPNSTPRRLSGTLPNGWDLVGGRLLTTTGGFRPGLDRTDVYLRFGQVGLSGRVLHHSASGLLSNVAFPRPTLGGRYAFVAQVRRGAAGQRFVRINVRTGEHQEATGRRAVILAVPLGDRVAYLSGGGAEASACSGPDDPPAPCQLRITPPLSYRPAR